MCVAAAPGTALAQGAPAETGDSSTTTVPAPPTSEDTTTTTTTEPATTAPPVTGAPTTTATLPTAGLPRQVPEQTTTTAPQRWDVIPEFTLPQLDTLQMSGSMLMVVRTQLDVLTAQHAADIARAERNEAVVADATAELDRVTEKLRTRAVASFMAANSIFDVKLHGDRTRKMLVTSVESVDASNGRAQKALRQIIDSKSAEAAAARAASAEVEPQIERLRLAQATLEAKINGTVDLSTPVAVGPSPIAAAAGQATAALSEMVKSVALANGTGPAATEKLRTVLGGLAALVQPLPGFPSAPATTTTTAAVDPAAATTPAPAATDPAAAPAPATAAGAVTDLTNLWMSLPLPRLQVMLFALQQVGKPYVWAAAGPNTYDCSGLVLRAFAEVGVKLPHFSGSQAHMGVPVTPLALQPTDVLSYGPDSSEHITMYIGGGRVVEAKGVAYGILVSNARYTGLAAATHLG